MHVHLIGICGTGMGAFAGLLKQAGHRVTGSDTGFYPPMGDALARWGIETLTGYDPAHLEPAPDLVIVGNVCRPDNPEARAAIERGLAHDSFPGALARMFLCDRRSFVVAGTHGKTTSSTLLAFLLDAAGQAPGFLVGGLPMDFDESFRVGDPGGPFVVEGDEYDSAFFEKTPKMWRYLPVRTSAERSAGDSGTPSAVAAIGSIEHDHVDIYPDMESYRAAFRGLVARMPPDGLLVLNAADAEVRALAADAPCRVVWCALHGDDTGNVDATWLAAPVASDDLAQPFDLFVGGSSCGRARSPLFGAHNVRNALLAIAVAAEGAGVPVHTLVTALARFGGVRRRQELRGIADGVRVFDDFAHHPTAVAETVRALRERRRGGRLIAVFEPRSATASRRLHQEAYGRAFAAADVVLLAPVGRKEIANAEKLDVEALASVVRGSGVTAEAPGSIDAIVERVAELATPGDTVVAMSNGEFGRIHERILARLAIGVMARRVSG
jgi:UDP-N-acetylmuramate: L-alanyl-gamma-D-glutamyl-meso-diaminopimelate ligase